MISLFSSVSFKFSSGLLEMKLQGIKSYRGLILFLCLPSWWAKNVIEEITHHAETQIMNVTKHSPLQRLKKHIQQSLTFKVSRYPSSKTCSLDPWTWRINNQIMHSIDQQAQAPSCPPILLESKNQWMMEAKFFHMLNKHRQDFKAVSTLWWISQCQSNM